jgi:urea transport system permease protein
MTKTILVFLLYACSLSAQAALDTSQVRQLAAEDSSDKVAAIRQLTQTAVPDAVRVLRAMADDGLYLAGDKAVITDGDRIRGELAGALAALELFDGERPFVFTNLKTGHGLQTIIDFIRERGMLG